MYKRILGLTALWMGFSGVGSAQPLVIEKQMLVGTWKLVSVSNVTDKGVVSGEAAQIPSAFSLTRLMAE
jgi:hypothetical protein